MDYSLPSWPQYFIALDLAQLELLDDLLSQGFHAIGDHGQHRVHCGLKTGNGHDRLLSEFKPTPCGYVLPWVMRHVGP